MIDRIQTFGDSFLFGTDLEDSNIIYSKSTWPALIARDLSLLYECRCLGGCGNHVISKNIFDHVKETSLVVINWTWIDRFDYRVDNKIQKKTIRPGNNDSTSEFFYKEIHAEGDDKFRSLSYIHSAHQYLRNNNIPFISTYMDHLLLDQRWNVSQGMIRLQNILESDLRTFPNNQTFLEWSRSNGYPESDNWHPLEQAHEEAAKIWLPIYEKEISKHITTK